MTVIASAPTRVDLAGGTIDIWPLYLFHPGAQTLNAAISLRASVRLEPRNDGRIVLASRDLACTTAPLAFDDLPADTTLPLLAKLAHAFGARGLTMTADCEAPAGAGIAGSSALNIAAAAALARFTGRTLTGDELLEVAKNVEAQVIQVPTGLQDYRPALHGGIAALELGVHGVRRVPLGLDPDELSARLVVCYTGAPRKSGINNWEITKRRIDGDAEVTRCFDGIVTAAAAMRRALDRGDWPTAAAALADEWRTRKQ
ncbi:MAG: GHMP kinase, partial [Acidobacteriota bacterium]